MVTTLNSSSPGQVNTDAAERSTPQTVAVEARLFDTARSLALASALRVGRLEEQIADLRAQIMDLQRQIVGLRAEAEHGRTAMERLAEYHPRVGESYLCPWCWIELESARRQHLCLTGHRVDPQDPRSDEMLNCRLCGNVWCVPP
jgi:hypothetical protein